jgi:hypothetical protein
MQKLKGAEKYFTGKDSAWTWIVFQVDEDEGSSSQDEAKPANNNQQVKIDRSAEALRVCHTRHSFPSKEDHTNNTFE